MNENPAEAGISVLIVDDSLAICQLLSAMLKDFGVTLVDYCHSGEDAFRMVERDPALYDALFVDLHMEGMDGLELMAKLNEIRYRGGVVVMSALDRKILDFTLEVISSYNLRVLGSAEKPFDKSLIAFMIKRIRNYRPHFPRREKVLKRREVYDAIKQSRILTYFQPKVSGGDNRLIGIECLVRLEMEGEGIIAPDRFIPVVEKFDLVDALLDSTLSVALPQYKEFVETSGANVPLAINISPMQLHNDVLPETLMEYLEKNDVDKSQVVLEITENHAIREEIQLKNLNRLRIHGFKLSLDDYGAGFTNIRQLKSLPFNEIKLDAKLIDGIRQDRVLQVIVRSVKNVCDELNLTLIAEGINDPDDLAMLNSIGVDGYQGYLFCRPKPLNELLRWYKVWVHTIHESRAKGVANPSV
ncbi:EAL domain-containing response regulator [Teredinibacter sp. KSP-S5-2]|uniref:EAL domain-containing response regulator n=1 Tax=Teredinibacter sp. KSP-S5-2 TaxID=3034506 RepID=UPI0029342BEF|nr:EAL domain-containing response regulator [Teredinibacter sp. KSP-S5-2]WNO08715.1 EAL domain-containing response regulator [Teredinibacter sp. KSP-S5-2]